MKKPIKRDSFWSCLQEYVRSRRDLLRSPQNSTVLIHVGKCGGRTLRNGLENAVVQHADLRTVHVRRPLYRSDLKYIVVARGPISRLKSAFRWRYRLVVTDGTQRHRFKEEYEVLVKYGTLNSLAEALYRDNGTANITAQRDIRKIHHIREDISFYLNDLLRKCRPSQIEAVLMQENLDADILRVFGYENKLTTHRNPATKDDDQLSDNGLSNLKRFFRKDYEVLLKLYCWGKIEKDIFIKALS